MMKLVPSPSLLLTVTEPPICSIIFLQMESPKPVPALFRLEFSSNLLKLMNSFEIPSGDIPIPLSFMLKLMLM